MQKILVIQTAFIGDVVLATGIVEKLHHYFPEAKIDFLLRKGNEALLRHHPFINEVLIWQKQKNKYTSLWKLLRKIRNHRYDRVINIQRFAATGFLTVFSGAVQTIGFDKNPWSFAFTKKVKHQISSAENPIHEIARNNLLIEDITGPVAFRPRLYPGPADEERIKEYRLAPYICIAPGSVWFTKQYPKDKWISFINQVPPACRIYLLGGNNDAEVCKEIKDGSGHPALSNLCGQLSFLESAALIRTAAMNYVNDSAPMHFASAVNAPVSAIYCSTLPSFGFGPLSENSTIIEIQEKLYCRPCGLHGRRSCPEKHFRCAGEIKDSQLLGVLKI